MSKSSAVDSGQESKQKKKEYRAPHLIDYGEVSELTDNLSGPGTGDDGQYPSYTQRIS